MPANRQILLASEKTYFATPSTCNNWIREVLHSNSLRHRSHIPLRTPGFPSRIAMMAARGVAEPFLTQCDLIFELQPRAFSSDRFRIAYIITLLTDKALKWATAIWAKQGSVCSSFRDFQEEMLLVFDQFTTGPDAAKLLMTIRQDKRSVTDYSVPHSRRRK